jgi:hypothetical protein
MSDRPLLVALIGIVTVIAAVIMIAIGVMFVLMTPERWADFVLNYESITFGYDIVTSLGILIIVVGLITLLIGTAIWNGWTVAWYIALIIYFIFAVISFLSIVGGSKEPILSFLIAIVILFYLTRPKVKAFFKV